VACADENTDLRPDSGSLVDAIASDSTSDAPDGAEPEPSLLVCDSVPEGFADCGGIPTGLWRIRQWCPDGALFDPLDGTCPETASTASGSATGLIQFGNDNEFVLRLESAATELNFRFNLSCYGGSTAPCDGSNFGGVCEVVGGGDQCACTREQSIVDEFRSGTWRRNGSFIELRLDGEPLVYARFCRVGVSSFAELSLPELNGVLPASVQLLRIE
jgi:hypothetical protein